MHYGYTLMSEEHRPRELVSIARTAEEVGFEFLVQSDHFHPWVPEQRHSPNCWAVLGAVAQATNRVALRTFVACPIIRYHPAIVAQQAKPNGHRRVEVSSGHGAETSNDAR
jgi:G6PDH family F420-dependent oxidoreductase